jgi:stage II sporulation protein M
MSRKDYIAYLASLRAYVLLAALLFIASFAIGYTASSLDPAFAERWTKELEVLRWIMNLNPILIMMIIFLKNLLACAMAILLGLGMGVVPLMVATSNGVLLGVVSHNAIKSHGLLFLIAGILPHGIIELPVVLISIAIGIRLGILL